MSTVIKVTDENGYSGHKFTNNPLRWDIGTTHIIYRDGIDVCSSGVIHVYKNKYMAVIMNSSYNNYQPFRMWEGDGGIVNDDSGLKCGVKALTITKELTGKDIPKISKKMSYRIAVLVNCYYIAQSMNKDKIKRAKDLKFLRWAVKYLTNKVTRAPFKFRYNNQYRYDSLCHVFLHDTFLSSVLMSYQQSSYNIADIVSYCFDKDEFKREVEKIKKYIKEHE